MKIYCQKCGSEIKKGRICSECGFRNKTQERRFWKIFKKIIISVFLFALICSGILFVFRDKISSYYHENYSDDSNDWSKDFEKGFTRLQGERMKIQMQSDFSNALALEIVEDREDERIVQKLEDSLLGLYICKNRVADQNKCSEIQETNKKNWEELYPIAIEKNKVFEEIISAKCFDDFDRCLEYQNKKIEIMPSICYNCDKEISGLFQKASEIDDSNKAELLLGLVGLLREKNDLENELRMQRIKEANFIKSFATIYKTANNNKTQWGILIKYVNEMEQINAEKDELTSLMEEKSEAILKKQAEANDYIAIVNGTLETDLKPWEYFKE